MSEIQAFERALAENPDDLAGWCAYADYLVEHDDPRGEFMQTQIALEDEGRSPGEREALRKKERELLKAHRADWLGELTPFVQDDDALLAAEAATARFARGWLDGLHFHSLTVNAARALARSPEARMLGRLLIDGVAVEMSAGTHDRYIDSYYQPGPDVPEGVDPYEGPALHALALAPVLANVRVFRLGDGPPAPGGEKEYYGPCWVNGSHVHELVARMPRLEELYLYAHGVEAAALFALPLSRLRVLRHDHATDYPFDVLAANPTLGNLTHVLCHPHAQRPDDPDAYIRLDQLRAICRSPHLAGLRHLQLRLTDFGDDGIREIIGSGILKRLNVLDLSLGCVTDNGARALAACPDLKNLSRLDLSQNALGDEGIAALEATGVSVNTTAQHGEHPDRMEHGYLEYLSNGDWE